MSAMETDTPAEDDDIESITLDVPDYKQLRSFTRTTIFGVALSEFFSVPKTGGGQLTARKVFEYEQQEELFNLLCNPHSDIYQDLETLGVGIFLNRKSRRVAVAAPEIPVSSADSWHIPFVDNLTVIYFLYCIWSICATFHQSIFHGPLFTLFQSSGWGKSRSIQGIIESKLCDVMYLCCRSSDSTGYPPRSTLFSAMLLKFTNLGHQLETAKTEYDMKLFAPFLYAIATCYYKVMVKEDELETLRTVMLDGTTLESQRLIDEMGSIYDTYAKLSYEDALVELLSAHQEFVSKLAPSDFNDNLKLKLFTLKNDNYSVTLIEKWFQKFFPDSGNAPSALWRPIVFVFDEARTLSKTSIMPGYSLYRIMRQILRETPRYNNALPLVGILMDTTSSITDLAPHELMDPSYRLTASGLNLKHMRPVFRMFTVDLLQDDNVHGPDMATKQMSLQRAVDQPPADDGDLKQLSFKELFSLGRPLWAAHMKGVAANASVASAVLLAKMKLCLGRLHLDPRDRAMCIACLASRMAFSFNERSELNESLVGNFMAFCRYISVDCKWMQIYYPSEPVLAEAAAQIWHENYPNQLFDMVQHLRMAMDDKQLTRGPKGEEIGKLLLLLARDGTFSRPLHEYYSSRVTFCDFLKSLVGDNIDNLNALPESFLKGLVTFTHFAHLHTLPGKSLWKRMWRRGAAAQFPERTRGMDLAIPVAIFKKRKWQITYVLIQIKNYSATTSEDNLNTTLHHKMTRSFLFKKYEDFSDAKTPYLCIYMQLGQHESNGTPVIQEIVRGSNNQSTGQFCLYLSGLTIETYPCLLQKVRNDVNKEAKVNSLVSELNLLLDSASEQLFAEEDEKVGMECLDANKKFSVLILDDADGTRASKSGIKTVRVIKEPEMEHL